MSAWIYRKPEATHIRGLCVLCKKNKQKKTTRTDKTLKTYYQALCKSCDNKRFGVKHYYNYFSKRYRKYKKLTCERCGFKSCDRCQLDIHHKDRNHHNNDPNNLETLCANCHRLEHKGEIGKTKPRKEP